MVMNILYHPSKNCNINYSILSIDLISGVIDYKLISGNLPIKVDLIGTTTQSNEHSSYGVYQFTGVDNEDYIFRVTDHKNCTKQEPIKMCNNCPEGYESIAGKCVRITEVSPNYVASSYTIIKQSGNKYYGRQGGMIFSSWNFDGTGTAEQFGVSPLNTYWANTVTPESSVNGMMNRKCVWGSTTYGGQKVGFSFCFNLAKGKILYVGFCVDNEGTLKLNGETILQQNNVAMTEAFGFPFGCHDAWYIYPIYIPAGNNVIEIYGYNFMPTNYGNPGAIGAAIYDATKAELMAATSDSDLTGKILWTSLEMLNKPLIYEYSEEHGFHGYSCPDGYALNSCGETVVCQLRETINCPE